MIVTCDKCNKSYDDARRYTICPHPELDDWNAHSIMADYKKLQDGGELEGEEARIGGMDTAVEIPEREATPVDTEPLEVPHIAEFAKTHDEFGRQHQCQVLKPEIVLSHAQIDRLCLLLGMPGVPVKDIIIKIDCERTVTFYTKGYVPVGAFDELLTMLASLKEKPDGQSSEA